jgi:hypothetical protein
LLVGKIKPFFILPVFGRRLVEELSVVDGQLVRNVIEDGPYGGNGGSAWTDGGEVHLNGHPSAVDVRTGSKLDAIRIKQVVHFLNEYICFITFCLIQTQTKMTI